MLELKVESFQSDICSANIDSVKDLQWITSLIQYCSLHNLIIRIHGRRYPDENYYWKLNNPILSTLNANILQGTTGIALRDETTKEECVLPLRIGQVWSHPENSSLIEIVGFNDNYNILEYTVWVPISENPHEKIVQLSSHTLSEALFQVGCSINI